ncbi:MAG: acyl-CoA dehydratase activase [Pseudomonadota bacterium]
MRVAGLDMGSLTTKATIIDDGTIIAESLIAATDEGEAQGRKTLEEALKGTGLSLGDIDYIVVTGEGRKTVSFAHKQKTTASCLARGTHWLFPSARMVIDVGGENCTVVKITDEGSVEESFTNDRCASGTGVFLEAMAKLMQMPLEEMAKLSLQAERKAEISSMCAIFAEQEVISHVHRPTPKNDIIAGIHASMVSRIVGFAKRIGIKPDVILTGGVAKNVGFAKILEEVLKTKLSIPDEPQMVAALGAARFAQEGKARKS